MKKRMNIYERFDEFMVANANAAVMTWNYITGGNKKDLANAISIGAGLTATIPMFMDDPKYGVIMGCAFLSMVNKDMTNHSEQHNLEQKAAIQEIKDQELHKKEVINKVLGPAELIAGPTLAYSISKAGVPEVGMPVGIATLVHSLTYYVMRADDLPRTKNYLARKLENTQSKLLESKI